MEYQVAVLPSSPFTELPEDTVHAGTTKVQRYLWPYFGGGLLFAIVYPEGKLSEFKKGHAADGKDTMTPCYPYRIFRVVRTEIIELLYVGETANGGTCVCDISLESVAWCRLLGDSGHECGCRWGANCGLESAAIFVKPCTMSRTI
jgi:hypothetical protein